MSDPHRPGGVSQSHRQKGVSGGRVFGRGNIVGGALAAQSRRADDDRAWRDQQVKAYADWLVRAKQPVPHYSVTPIRRSDLPRKWTPLPALGFLRGQMI